MAAGHINGSRTCYEWQQDMLLMAAGHIINGSRTLLMAARHIINGSRTIILLMTAGIAEDDELLIAAAENVWVCVW